MKTKNKIKVSHAGQPITSAAVPAARNGTEPGAADEYKLIPRLEIFPDPDQPRKTFDAAGLQSLADSITEQGIVQPLIVRREQAQFKIQEPDMHNQDYQLLKATPASDIPWTQVDRCDEKNFKSLRETWAGNFGGQGNPSDYVDRYVLISGERRWRAAALAGLAVLPCVVRDVDARRQFAQQFIENSQREAVAALEEAMALSRQLDARRAAAPGFKAEDLARDVGLSRAGLYARLVLTRLHEPVRAAMLAGKISASVAGIVAVVPDPAEQKRLLAQITDEGDWRYPYSVREVQELVNKDYVKQLKDAPFDPKYNFGNDHLPACGPCPHRSGNLAEQFPDLAKRPNVCTRVSCFEAKVQAHNAAEAAAAKAKGLETMSEELFEKSQDDFVKAEDTNYKSPGYKSWGTLMGKHKPQPVLVLTAEGPVEVFKKAEAQLALKANGVKLASSGTLGDVDRKRIQKKTELEATAKAATGQVLAKLVTAQGIDGRLWQLLADGVAQLLSIETESFIAKRRGLAQKIGEVRDGLESWLTAKRTDAELQGFIVEALVCARWNDGYDPKFSAEFKQVCELAGGTPAELADSEEKQENQGGFWDPNTDDNGKPKKKGKSLAEKLEQAKAKLPGLTPAAKAKIAAAAKARWAKIKVAKKG